jgi:outer membrane biosynthesis protein TonB
MKRMLLHRLGIIGALAGIIVIAGAVRTAATPSHGQVHLVVASSSGSVAARHVERQAESQPTPEAAENEAAENEAAEKANEPAEEANEPAEEANEPAEEANEPAEEANEPADIENEHPATPAPTAPPAPPTSQPTTSTQTFALVGGTVTVTCSGNAITLNSATPNTGFTIDKQENEDGQVEVRFRNDDHESRLQVACQNGAVVVEELREDNS